MIKWGQRRVAVFRSENHPLKAGNGTGRQFEEVCHNRRMGRERLELWNVGVCHECTGGRGGRLQPVQGNLLDRLALGEEEAYVNRVNK